MRLKSGVFSPVNLSMFIVRTYICVFLHAYIDFDNEMLIADAMHMDTCGLVVTENTIACMHAT